MRASSRGTLCAPAPPCAGRSRSPPTRLPAASAAWRCGSRTPHLGRRGTGAAKSLSARPSPRPTRSSACAMARFLSLIDPPADLREAAAACVNQGAWPVLVGGERDATRCWLRRSFSTTTRRSPRRARALLRRHRDRRDPDPAHPCDDRCRKAGNAPRRHPCPRLAPTGRGVDPGAIRPAARRHAASGLGRSILRR